MALFKQASGMCMELYNRCKANEAENTVLKESMKKMQNKNKVLLTESQVELDETGLEVVPKIMIKKMHQELSQCQGNLRDAHMNIFELEMKIKELYIEKEAIKSGEADNKGSDDQEEASTAYNSQTCQKNMSKSRKQRNSMRKISSEESEGESGETSTNQDLEEGNGDEEEPSRFYSESKNQKSPQKQLDRDKSRLELLEVVNQDLKDRLIIKEVILSPSYF